MSTYQRNYSADEMRALRRVDRNIWKSGNPAERGPAQYASGTFWPDELRTQARDMEDLARDCRLAANALEREINNDPRTADAPDHHGTACVCLDCLDAQAQDDADELAQDWMDEAVGR